MSRVGADVSIDARPGPSTYSPPQDECGRSSSSGGDGFLLLISGKHYCVDGAICEYDGGTDCYASPGINPAHRRRHVVAASIKTLDCIALCIQDVSVTVRRQSGRRAKGCRKERQRDKWSVLDWSKIWIFSDGRIAERAIESRFPTLKEGIPSLGSVRVVFLDRLLKHSGI